MATSLQLNQLSGNSEPWGGREIDPALMAELRAQCQGPLSVILQGRGANATETEDVLADLWSDCVGQPGRPSLLEKFSGRTSLLNWLATVATHRWIDAKRRQARWVPVEPGFCESLESQVFAELNRTGNTAGEEILTRLLRESLRAAFARCPAQSLVLLRLVHMHGLSQREVGRMLRWSETKLSRYLNSTLRQIERDTLGEVRRRDPWLQLTWQDFLDLCENGHEGFL